MAKEKEIKKFIDSAYKNADIFLEELELAMKSYSQDNIHNFRISIRKLISTISVVNDIIEDENLLNFSKEIKKILKWLNQTRDTDVQIKYFTSLEDKYKSSKSLTKELSEKNSILNKEATKSLNEVDFKSIKNWIKNFKKVIENNLENVNRKNIIKSLEKSYVKLVELRKKIDENKPKSIHKVRVAFKKFRYTCELMLDLLWLSEKEVEEMRAFQKKLWKIQDTEVSIKYVKDSWSKEKLKDMEKYLEKKRKKRISKLLEEIEYVDNLYKVLGIKKS